MTVTYFLGHQKKNIPLSTSGIESSTSSDIVSETAPSTPDDPIYQTGQLEEVNIMGRPNLLQVAAERSGANTPFNFAESSNPVLVEAYNRKLARQSQRLSDLNQVYDASQGAGTVQNIQTVDAQEDVPEPTVGESMVNSGKNMINRLKGAMPRLQLVAADAWENILGKELAQGWYELEGRDINDVRQLAYLELDQLANEVKPTLGIVNSIERNDLAGVSAGIVNGITSLGSSFVPAVATGGAGIFTEMVGDAIVDFNETKAKKLGKSVNDLYKDDEAEFGIPATVGTLGGALELIGLKGVSNLISKKIAGTALKKAAIMFGEANKEGLTEFVQTGLEVANNSLASGDSSTEASKKAVDAMFSKQGLESYLQGVFASAGAGGLGRITSSLTNPQAKVSLSEELAKINMLEMDLQKTEISPQSRSVLESQLDQSIKTVSDIVEEDEKFEESIPKENRPEVARIAKEMDDIQAVINDPSVSEEVKKQVEAQIVPLQKELDEAMKPLPEVVKEEPVEEVKIEPVEAVVEEEVTPTPVIEEAVVSEPLQVTEEPVVEPVQEIDPKKGDQLRAFAEKIRGGKINKLGGFKASTGFDAVWDMSLESVALSVEQGAKIVDAIEVGLNEIKKTDWYKNLQDKNDFDQKYKAHISEEFSKGTAGFGAEGKAQTLTDAQLNERTTSMSNRNDLSYDEKLELSSLLEESGQRLKERLLNEDITEARTILKEIEGTGRKPIPAKQVQVIQGLIDKYENPSEITENDLESTVKDSMLSLAKTATSSDSYYTNRIDLREAVNELRRRGYSDSQIVDLAKGEFNKYKYDPTKADDKISNLLIPLLNNKPVVNLSKTLRSFATKVREGKINKLGGFKASTGFDAVWDLSLETVATALEAGATIADAIQAGLNAIKKTEWYESQSDKDGFNKKYTAHMESEFESPAPQSEVSGIKKKLVSDEIVANTDFEKISDKKMQEMGKSLIDSGEVKPRDIVNEIAGTQGTNASPRALQPKEVVALIHYKTDLDNQRRKLLTKFNKATEAGESTASIQAQLSDVQNDIESYDKMSVITAQQQSLAFRLRQGLLDKDYNLVTQIEQYKAVNGGVIPPEVEARFRELDKQLTDLKQQISEAQERATIAEEALAMKNIVEDVARDKSKPKKNTKTTKEEARLKELRKKYSGVLNDITRILTLLAEKDFREYARLVLKDVGGDFTAFGKELIKSVGEKIRPYIPKLFNDVGGKGTYTIMDLAEQPSVENGELQIPPSYIRALVESGITEIDELSEAVRKKVEAELPDVTVRQVRDAITRYGKQVNQTQDQIQKQLNQAKRLGRLYSSLEDLQSQQARAKTIRQKAEIGNKERELKRQIQALEADMPKTPEQRAKATQQAIDNAKKRIDELSKAIDSGTKIDAKESSVVETAELKTLREERDSLQKEYDEMINPKRTPEQIRLDNKKAYLERFIEEKQQRLRDKNFAPKAKPQPLVGDSELQRLQAEANRVRNEYEEAHYENEQNNRTRGQKIYDGAIEWGTGLQRALTAGLDFSAMGVQGIINILSSDPRKSAAVARESFNFMMSEKYEKDFMAKLQAEPDYQIMKASGLALQFPNSKLGSRDYQLSAGVVNQVWNGLVYPLKLVSQKAYEVAKRVNPYRATERAFTGAIDTMRVQLFRQMAQDLQNQGITFESDPEAYKIAANATNNLTFRGRLRTLEPISKELAVVFFAPRKIAAALSLTNPYYYASLWATQPVVAKRLTLKMATFIAVATTITLAFKAFREDDDEDENPDVFNPLSPDFMKLRIGNTRLDFFGGLNQNVILASRLYSNQYKTSSSVRTHELGSNSFVPTRWELIEKYFTNKFAPTSQLAYKYLNQSAGREVDWDDEAVNAVTPIWAQNVGELYKEHPTTMATFLTFMGFIGQNMSTYGGADFLKQDKDDQLIELAKSKGSSFNTKSRSSIEVYDAETAEKRPITKEEYKQYKESYGNFIKGELTSRFKEMKDMTPQKFENTMQSIKSSATKYAKQRISGVSESIANIRHKEDSYELDTKQIKERIKINEEFLAREGVRLREGIIQNLIRKENMSRRQAEIRAELELQKKANKYSNEIMVNNEFKANKKITFKEK